MSAETTPAAYTDADVQAARVATHDAASFTQQEVSHVWVEGADTALVRAALDAVAPAIAARALREFATHIQSAEWPMPPDIGHVAMEAHARADEIEAGR